MHFRHSSWIGTRTAAAHGPQNPRRVYLRLEIAIENIPENQKVNLPVYEQALKALKEKS